MSERYEDKVYVVANGIQNNVPVIVSVFTLCWVFLYIMVRRSFHKRSPEFCIRLVTLIHGIITSYFGVRECMIGGIFGDGVPMKNYQAFLLTFSASYFVLDLLWCILYQTETRLMLFHHLYSCTALMRIISKGYSGTQSVCGIGTAEVTNPFLQTRWFLRTLGYQNNPLYTIIEIIFVILFVTARILFGTIFILAVIFTRSNNFEYKILSLLIYILSWMFFYNIVRYLHKKYMNTRVNEEDDFKHSPSS